MEQTLGNAGGIQGAYISDIPIQYFDPKILSLKYSFWPILRLGSELLQVFCKLKSVFGFYFLPRPTRMSVQLVF